MPRPGVDVVITETAPVGGAILDSGQAFMVGETERGPTRTPLEVRSLRTFERACGPRIGGARAHDAARAFFTEGGSVFWYLRLAGDGAASATGEVGPLKVTASSPGAWGNSVTVALEADAGAVGALIAEAHAGANGERQSRQGNGDEEVAGRQTSNGGGPMLRVVVRRGGEVVERRQRRQRVGGHGRRNAELLH